MSISGGGMGAAQPDEVEAKVDKLYSAMNRLGTDEEAIYEVLEGSTAAEQEAIERRFDQKYTLHSLKEWLTSELTTPELKRAMAALGSVDEKGYYDGYMDDIHGGSFDGADVLGILTYGGAVAAAATGLITGSTLALMIAGSMMLGGIMIGFATR